MHQKDQISLGRIYQNSWTKDQISLPRIEQLLYPNLLNQLPLARWGWLPSQVVWQNDMPIWHAKTTGQNDMSNWQLPKWQPLLLLAPLQENQATTNRHLVARYFVKLFTSGQNWHTICLRVRACVRVKIRIGIVVIGIPFALAQFCIKLTTDWSQIDSFVNYCTT